MAARDRTIHDLAQPNFFLEVDQGVGLCEIKLPVSKADLLALEKERSHSCACKATRHLFPASVVRKFHDAALQYSPSGKAVPCMRVPEAGGDGCHGHEGHRPQLPGHWCAGSGDRLCGVVADSSLLSLGVAGGSGVRPGLPTVQVAQGLHLVEVKEADALNEHTDKDGVVDEVLDQAVNCANFGGQENQNVEERIQKGVYEVVTELQKVVTSRLKYVRPDSDKVCYTSGKQPLCVGLVGGGQEKVTCCESPRHLERGVRSARTWLPGVWKGNDQ